MSRWRGAGKTADGDSIKRVCKKFWSVREVTKVAERKESQVGRILDSWAAKVSPGSSSRRPSSAVGSEPDVLPAPSGAPSRLH